MSKEFKRTPYSEKLRDPRWQKMRLKIMERDKFTCQLCNDDKSTLNVHHRVYERGVEPWDHDDEVLVTLCERCHQREYENRQADEQALLDVARRRLFTDDLTPLRQLIYAMPLFSDAAPDHATRYQLFAMAWYLSIEGNIQDILKKYKEAGFPEPEGCYPGEFGELDDTDLEESK